MTLLASSLRILVLLPALLVLSVAMSVLLFKLAAGAGHTLWTHPLMLCLGSGFLIRLIIKIIFNYKNHRDPLEFIDTLEHELTHALFGYITLSPPSSLKASSQSGGEVRLKRKNPPVILSPYLFPLLTGFSFCIGFLLRSDLQTFWNGLTAFLMGNFIFRLSTEIRWYQEDLREYGFLFSVSLIYFFLISESLLFFKFAVGVDFPFWQSISSETTRIILAMSSWLE